MWVASKANIINATWFWLEQFQKLSLEKIKTGTKQSKRSQFEKWRPNRIKIAAQKVFRTSYYI